MAYFGLHGSCSVRVAPAIELSEDDEDELIRLAHSKVDSVRLVERARIVLLAAQGLQDRQIAEELDIDRITAGRWRKRYIDSGLAGIERDLPRGAPPVKVNVAERSSGPRAPATSCRR
jgi:Homeodomain-like domain